ncbi:predicted protein [Nematostella vectensis]|uniref:G-protein coupled receptors family 1 profile domain-containing protein n=3 Tax=Nematostella vectensis TaxID=45351 RepID=A7SSM6_NEMVE|nr:predicted protein [Nematostella vectensis]|eukprot:XP_001625376.1 predicted protein [Nematostella vectensis]
MINCLAFAGNTIVVVAFFRSPSLQTPTNIFIVALSISDIIMSVFPMPLTAGAVITGAWSYGGTLCHIQGYLVHVLAFISIEIMALTAINRYCKTLQPSQYSKLFKDSYSAYYIIVVCAVSCGILAVTIFPEPSESFVFHPGKLICVRLYSSLAASRVYTAALSVMFIVTPAAIIIFCYAKVLLALHRHSTKIQCRYNPRGRGSVRFDTNTNSSESRQSLVVVRPDIVITRTLVITVICFFVCWVPCFLIDVVDVTIAHALDRRVYLAYTCLAYMSSACNPLVYGIHNPAFRKGFLNFLKCG